MEGDIYPNRVGTIGSRGAACMGYGRRVPSILAPRKYSIRLSTIHLSDDHKGVVDTLDVRVFLRVPHDVLKERRHERHGYHTAGMQHSILFYYFPSPLRTVSRISNSPTFYSLWLLPPLSPTTHPLYFRTYRQHFLRFRTTREMNAYQMENNLIQKAHYGEIHLNIGNKLCGLLTVRHTSICLKTAISRGGSRMGKSRV